METADELPERLAFLQPADAELKEVWALEWMKKLRAELEQKLRLEMDQVRRDEQRKADDRVAEAEKKTMETLSNFPALTQEGFPPLGPIAGDSTFSRQGPVSSPKRGSLAPCSFEHFDFYSTVTRLFTKYTANRPISAESQLRCLVHLCISGLLDSMNLAQLKAVFAAPLGMVSVGSAQSNTSKNASASRENVADARSSSGVSGGEATKPSSQMRNLPDVMMVTINDKPVVCVEVKLPPSTTTTPGEALEQGHLLAQVGECMKGVYLSSGVRQQFAIVTNYKYTAFVWTEDANELAEASLSLTRDQLASWASAAARFHPEPFLQQHPLISTSVKAELAPEVTVNLTNESETPAASFDVRDELRRFDPGNMFMSTAYATENDPEGVLMLCSVLVKAIVGFISPYIEFGDQCKYTPKGVDDKLTRAPRILSQPGEFLGRVFLCLSTSQGAKMHLTSYPTEYDYANLMDPQTKNFTILWHFRSGADGRTALAFYKTKDEPFKYCVLKMPLNANDHSSDMAEKEAARWNLLYDNIWLREDPAFLVKLIGLSGESFTAVALPYVGPVDMETRNSSEFKEAVDAAIQNIALKGWRHDDLEWRHVGVVFRDNEMRVILFDLTRMSEIEKTPESFADAVKIMRDRLDL